VNSQLSSDNIHQIYSADTNARELCAMSLLNHDIPNMIETLFLQGAINKPNRMVITVEPCSEIGTIGDWKVRLKLSVFHAVGKSPEAENIALRERVKQLEHDGGQNELIAMAKESLRRDLV